MSDVSLPVSRLGDRANVWLERAAQYARKHREAWPAVAIIVATVAAYHFTLASMFDFLRLDTPLAYLPLLPLFCVGIAIITARRYQFAKRPIQDRQIDFLVGIPMVVLALLLITLAPVIASTYYWSDRADVVSMALFAAGATIIGYGITWMWRLKASFIFLLLMWPALYLHLMSGVMQRFTDVTNSALARIVQHVPLGTTLGANPGDLIVTVPHGAPLTISIVTACSGANSVLGFALIGGAILTVMGGGRGRKLLWWITGMALAFALNIVRLTSIIFLAHIGHPSLALGGYHAVIGLVLFAVVVLVMLWALPLFGLHYKEQVKDKISVAAKAAAAAASRPRGWTRKRKVATGIVVALTAVVALADHGLQPYAAFDDGSGSPTVKPFGAASAMKGWTIQAIAQYPWVTQYFGQNSTWYRYTVVRPGVSNVSYADVVLTDDKGSLDAYNLLNCFLFHNYDIRTSEKIDLGNGVYGLLLNYTDPATNTKWATVSWAWPVTNKGETFYERIALTSSPLQGTSVQPGVAQPQGFGIQDLLLDLLNGVSGGHNDPKAAPLFKSVDSALQGEAGSLVGHTVQAGS
jgi:exosortase/archaeosortase family protein